MVLKPAAAALSLALLLAGCSDDGTSGGRQPVAEAAGDTAGAHDGADAAHKDPAEESKTSEAASDDEPARIDPRRNGFEITLGEWAVTPEAPALRPGPVTFVITNRGTMDHGFEIELEGESSGSGSGDLFKAESELLAPGESTSMTVELSPGIHKIECLVDGHDDMGMEGPLEVRKDAPFVKEEESDASGSDGVVAVTNFSFDPDSIAVDAGTEVTWRNEDPASHTVTATSDRFDSGTLEPGARFSFQFGRPGTYRYFCNIHPDMKGTVTVE